MPDESSPETVIMSPLHSIPAEDFDQVAYKLGYEHGHGDVLASLRETRDVIASQGPLIYRKLAAVMAELPAVGKDSKNEQQGWNFRGVDAVVNAVSPAMRKHGVIVVPEMIESGYRDTLTAGRDPRPTREVTVKVRYTFYAEDGSSVAAVVPGESLDQSDKGSAKAMSVAFRIAFLQVFALPTSEPDPDASYHTRDGVGSMSPSVAKLLADRVPEADAAELADLWPIVMEHSAAERPGVPGLDDGTTWGKLFLDNFTALIEATETWEQGKALLTEVRRAGLERHLLPKLNERAAAIRARGEARFNELMAATTAARSKEELAVVAKDAADARMDEILSEDQFVQLCGVSQDRVKKLPETYDPRVENGTTDDGPNGSKS